MVTFTAIITGFGALIGVLKSALELRVAFKDLFKKEIKLNAAFADFSKQDEKVLTNLYKAIEIGKETTNRIYKQLLIKYLISGIVTIIIITSLTIFIQSIFAFKPWAHIALFLGSYLFTTNIFVKPFKIRLPDVEAVQEVAAYVGQVQTDLKKRVYEVSRLLGLLGWITVGEKKYLRNYLDLCSLRDTIEMYWINRKVEQAKTHVFETANLRQNFEEVFIDILENIIKAKGNVYQNRQQVINQIKARGFERFLLLFDDKFFRQDFQQQYELYSRKGIKQIINEYW